MKNQHPQTVIFFDGVCNLCNALIDFVSQSEKKSPIFMASLQGETAGLYQLKNQLPVRQGPDFQTIYVVQSGKIFEKSDAIIVILKNLKKLSWLGTALKVLPRPLRDLSYNFVAKNRYLIFGKRKSCRIPTADERHFFLP